jgi:hypothetical protein|tara:strand:- start:189 stop:1235 length:1047 start_codon:yes stop_codon:yes gene_type:complete
MKGALWLPVAPRPNRDELLSSWMTRVAGCYGLEGATLTAFLAGQGRAFRQVNDIAPDPFHLRLWARASRVDPARLSRLSLTSRYPDRLSTWFLERAGVPVCLGCFDADHATGRDCYMRADWRLAEHVVCPTHGEMLHDRCPACRGHLRISCRVRNGLQRPFCSRCDVQLTGRVGEAAGLASVEFTAGVLDLQREVQKVFRGNDDRLTRLEHMTRTLWAPLDRVDAARPVLALWFDQPGWNCPFEARAAVSSQAPLQHLSVRWRALTLVILHDLFGEGLGSDADMPEAAQRLFRRAAPMRPRRQMSAIGKGKLSVDGATKRVQRLSKSPVHRLSGNFLDERGDFGRIHP